jgi:SAM-dependent methyltransferase
MNSLSKPDTTSQQFFEHKYREDRDPWDFASSPYETERYDAIVRALSHRRYEMAFEPGCSIGVLTARLAPLCAHLQAIDISPTAVQRARERCQDLENVEINRGSLPGYLPRGPLDLVVLSEIGYYFTADALQRVATALLTHLAPGGVLLGAHWLGESEDHLLSGDQVHDILLSLDGLVLDRVERHRGFRLDRWVRAPLAGEP